MGEDFQTDFAFHKSEDRDKVGGAILDLFASQVRTLFGGSCSAGHGP